jgi:hypothetical protein
MTPWLMAYRATPRTQAGSVVVGRRGSATAPSSALPSHVLDAARPGQNQGVMPA